MSAPSPLPYRLGGQSRAQIARQRARIRREARARARRLILDDQDYLSYRRSRAASLRFLRWVNGGNPFVPARSPDPDLRIEQQLAPGPRFWRGVMSALAIEAAFVAGALAAWWLR